MEDHVFSFEKEADFIQDREDLISVLQMRFGNVPPSVIQKIYDINELDSLERLILVAANAPEFKIFLEEIEEGSEGFRIIGERFNPIGSMFEGGD